MRRETKARKLLGDLPEEQRTALLEVLRGHRFVLHIDGALYAVRPHPWRFQPLDFSAPEHTVLGDACSCEDSRFRLRKCKHIRALEEVFGGPYPAGVGSEVQHERAPGV